MPFIFPNFPLNKWLFASCRFLILILSGYTSIRQPASCSGYEFKPCPMYSLIASTFWSWYGSPLLQSMSKHALGHHVDQGLLPAGSTGKTRLPFCRSLVGLKKRGMDKLVTYPKDTGMWLGIDAEHHQFQYLTTPKPALPCHVAQLLHHYFPTPNPFICLIKIPFPLSLPPSIYSMSFGSCTAETDSFFLPSVKQKWGSGTEISWESFLCVCSFWNK